MFNLFCKDTDAPVTILLNCLNVLKLHQYYFLQNSLQVLCHWVCLGLFQFCFYVLYLPQFVFRFLHALRCCLHPPSSLPSKWKSSLRKLELEKQSCLLWQRGTSYLKNIKDDFRGFKSPNWLLLLNTTRLLSTSKLITLQSCSQVECIEFSAIFITIRSSLFSARHHESQFVLQCLALSPLCYESSLKIVAKVSPALIIVIILLQ